MIRSYNPPHYAVVSREPVGASVFFAQGYEFASRYFIETLGCGCQRRVAVCGGISGYAIVPDHNRLSRSHLIEAQGRQVPRLDPARQCCPFSRRCDSPNHKATSDARAAWFRRMMKFNKYIRQRQRIREDEGSYR